MATPAKVSKPDGKNNHDAADEQAGMFCFILTTMLNVCICATYFIFSGFVVMFNITLRKVINA